MSPLLAMILSQSDYLMNQDWRRRQVAACNLRGIFSMLNRRNVQHLDYYMVQKSSANS